MKTIDLNERLVYYSEGEELANRCTHAIGALAGLIGAIVLISLAS
ncbi:MAG: hypothetical protein ACYDHC_05150 [Desulfuromonadaceae bacterium]